jgi:hypothetical protein
MQNKGLFILLLMFTCCFSILSNTAALSAPTDVHLAAASENANVSEKPAEILNFNGPWTSGKVIAWAFVAFIAFVMLLIFFKVIASSIQTGKLKISKSGENPETVALQVLKLSSSKKKVPEEVYAAIAMALYESNEDAHDIENAILTFYNIARTYSPWNSKIYGLRQIPQRR